MRGKVAAHFVIFEKEYVCAVRAAQVVCGHESVCPCRTLQFYPPQTTRYWGDGAQVGMERPRRECYWAWENDMKQRA